MLSDSNHIDIYIYTDLNDFMVVLGIIKMYENFEMSSILVASS